jgi:hypothetical protein
MGLRQVFCWSEEDIDPSSVMSLTTCVDRWQRFQKIWLDVNWYGICRA